MFRLQESKKQRYFYMSNIALIKQINVVHLSLEIMRWIHQSGI